jgi:hypothetical protein
MVKQFIVIEFFVYLIIVCVRHHFHCCFHLNYVEMERYSLVNFVADVVPELNSSECFVVDVALTLQF